METAEYTFTEEPADNSSVDTSSTIDLGDTDSLVGIDEVDDLANEVELNNGDGLAGVDEVDDLANEVELNNGDRLAGVDEADDLANEVELNNGDRLAGVDEVDDLANEVELNNGDGLAGVDEADDLANEVELNNGDGLAGVDEVDDLTDEVELNSSGGLAGVDEVDDLADLEDTRDNPPDTAPVPDTDEDVGSDGTADAGMLEPEVGDIDNLDGTDDVADIETEAPEARDSTGRIQQAAGVIDSPDQSHTDVLAAGVAEIDELDGVDDVADIDNVDDVAFQTTDERSGAAGVDTDMVETRPGNPAGLADVEAMDDARYVAHGDLEDRGAAQMLVEQSAGVETSIEADGRADGVADGLLEADPQNAETGTATAAEAEGLPALVGPEQTELYHNPEDVVEKEPGLGPKPSWSEAPDSPPEDLPPVDGSPPLEQEKGANETSDSKGQVEKVSDEVIHVPEEQEIWFDELEPDKVYEKDGYTFRTDEQGRPSTIQGFLQLQPGVRTPQQTEIGHLGEENDEGGHLIATRFNGPPDGFNLVPQDANLNRGAWKSMENEWAEELNAGNQVEVGVQPVYLDDSRRPTGFDVIYRVVDPFGDRYYTKTFYNESAEEK